MLLRNNTTPLEVMTTCIQNGSHCGRKESKLCPSLQISKKKDIENMDRLRTTRPGHNQRRTLERQRKIPVVSNISCPGHKSIQVCKSQEKRPSTSHRISPFRA
jgi:hypothetical protein